MNQTGVSIIIPWSDRAELRDTLRSNVALLGNYNHEVLVVNCGSDSRVLGGILSGTATRQLVQIDIPAATFNKSLSLNVGIHFATHDVLLFLDADVFLGATIDSLVERCRDGGCFVVFNGVKERPLPPAPPFVGSDSFLQTLTWESHLTFVWGDGSSTTVRRAYQDLGSGRRFGPGLMLVRKAHLLAIEGFCSFFDGWGWEDVDVHLRLQRELNLIPIYSDHEIFHLAHDDRKRQLGGVDRRDSARRNFQKSCSEYAVRSFSGTYSSDLRRWLDEVRVRALGEPSGEAAGAALADP